MQNVAGKITILREKVSRKCGIKFSHAKFVSKKIDFEN